MALQTTGAITIAQVRNALGESTYDLAGLCKSDKINRWSQWKPMAVAQVGKLDMSKNPTQGAREWYGLRPSWCGAEEYNFLGLFKQFRSINHPNLWPDWTHHKPTGRADAPYRLSDFYGYEHRDVTMGRDSLAEAETIYNPKITTGGHYYDVNKFERTSVTFGASIGYGSFSNFYKLVPGCGCLRLCVEFYYLNVSISALEKPIHEVRGGNLWQSSAKAASLTVDFTAKDNEVIANGVYSVAIGFKFFENENSTTPLKGGALVMPPTFWGPQGCPSMFANIRVAKWLSVVITNIQQQIGGGGWTGIVGGEVYKQSSLQFRASFERKKEAYTLKFRGELDLLITTSDIKSNLDYSYTGGNVNVKVYSKPTTQTMTATSSTGLSTLIIFKVSDIDTTKKVTIGGKQYTVPNIGFSRVTHAVVKYCLSTEDETIDANWAEVVSASFN